MDACDFELMTVEMKNRSFHQKPANSEALSCLVDKSKRDRIFNLKNENNVFFRDVKFEQSSQWNLDKMDATVALKIKL